MCLKAVLRKILAFVAVLGELVYLLLSVGFHIPFAWYLKQQSGGAQSQRIEWIGGLWTYCFSNLGLDKQEWHCNEVTEKIALVPSICTYNNFLAYREIISCWKVNAGCLEFNYSKKRSWQAWTFSIFQFFRNTFSK